MSSELDSLSDEDGQAASVADGGGEQRVGGRARGAAVRAEFAVMLLVVAELGDHLHAQTKRAELTTWSSALQTQD